MQQAKPDCRFETILDETTAINTALDNAPLNSLVVILPESVSHAIGLIEQRRPIADPESVTVETSAIPADTPSPAPSSEVPSAL